MTDDERDVRDQVEEDGQEDLELAEDRAGDVRGGDTATDATKKLPGNTKWGDIELKRSP
jgi:hypothetical protein